MIDNLRKVIMSYLNRLKFTYSDVSIGYRLASDQKMYPHVVFDIDPISPTDMGRYDFNVDFHFWDKDASKVFALMEWLEMRLRFATEQSNGILPTFYTNSFGILDDPDKTLIHGVLRVECQVYEVSIANDAILEPVFAS